FAQLRAGQLLGAARVVEIEVHRERDQHRVFDAPRRRLASQQRVFPGPRTGVGQSEIHSGGVRLEQVAIERGAVLYDRARDTAKVMDAVFLIELQHRLAEQLGELARSGAAHEIHLEEAILTMRIAGRERQVAARGRANRRRALLVAYDGRTGLESRSSNFAVDLREARAQRQVGRKSGDYRKGGNRKRCVAGDSERTHARPVRPALRGSSSRWSYRTRPSAPLS